MEREWANIQKHIDKADKRVEASRLLFEKGFLEDSISRAYTMYYAARAVLMLKELSPRTHRGLISQFGLEFVTKGYLEELLGRAISFAQEERETAHYDVFAVFTEEKVENVLKKAENFVSKIKEFLEKVRKGEIEVK